MSTSIDEQETAKRETIDKCEKGLRIASGGGCQ